jgi:6-phosphogluconolactonase
VRLIVGADAAAAARLAAAEIAAACIAAVASRGHALVALSGGETPGPMIEAFGSLDLPWHSICVAQVDERCVPRGDPRRNLRRIEEALVRNGRLPAANLLAMPVEETDLEAAAADYALRLVALAGAPLRIDLVQLGLGADGHTASLVPGDPVLAVDDRDVALSGTYQGLRRMTLTLRALSAARQRLWLVTGDAKTTRLGELLAGEGDAPSVRVAAGNTTVVADRAAAPSAA